jgi:hypothetical protein
VAEPFSDRRSDRSLNDTGRDIAVDWISSTWRQTQDTRWAVTTLARLGETDPDFHRGLLIGIDDEWRLGTARRRPESGRET